MTAEADQIPLVRGDTTRSAVIDRRYRNRRCKGRVTLFSGRMLASHLLFSAAFSLILVTTLNAEKPFDFATTPGKLPKQVVPEEYAIRIAPDIANRTFTGTETVKLNVREPVRQLVLNARVDPVVSPNATISMFQSKEDRVTVLWVDGLTSLPSEYAAK